MSRARDRLRTWLLDRAPGAKRPLLLDRAARPDVPARARVLLIRPDHLGDVLFTGPALARLRAAWPQAQITLLVGPWAADLAGSLPGADHVTTTEFPWFDRRTKGAPWRPYVRLVRAARRLEAASPRPYEVAIVLRDDDWWGAWLAALAGIPLRIGHDRPGVRTFLTHALPTEQCPTHSAAANIALIAALAGQPGSAPSPVTDPLAVRLTSTDFEKAGALLARDGGDPTTKPVAIHPGSGSAVKRWRTGAWCELIRRITSPGESVVLTGSAGETALTRSIASRTDRPAVELAGRTDLRTLMAVFARCRLVLGPDSGPLHLAVAMGTPTVHLFGPADPLRFGPWGPPERHRVVSADLPCAPCGRLDWPAPEDHQCVRALDLDRVIAAAISVGG